MPQRVSQPSLAALGRVVIERAKRPRAFAKRAQSAMLVLGVIAVVVQAAPSLFDPDRSIPWLVPRTKQAAYMCAVVALALQMGRWCLQRVAGDRHALGSSIKRRALIVDALGSADEPIEIRLLRDLAGAEAEEEARKSPIQSDYYASTAAPSLARLRENLQECAFFSRSLYRLASRAAFWKFGVTCAGLVVAMLVIAFYAPRDVGSIVANCALVFVGSLVTTDQLGQAMSWQRAAHQLEGIERRLEGAENEAFGSYLAVFTDYEVITATASPVPTELYQGEVERLNRLWKGPAGQR